MAALCKVLWARSERTLWIYSNWTKVWRSSSAFIHIKVCMCPNLNDFFWAYEALVPFLEFSFWPRYNFVEPLTYQYVLGNLSLSRWHVDPSNWIYILRVPSFIFHVPLTSCYWEKKGKVRSSVAIFDAAIINTKEYSSCRCFLRRINLINCPTWVRPALTISDHKGIFYTVFNLNTQVAEKCET